MFCFVLIQPIQGPSPFFIDCVSFNPVPVGTSDINLMHERTQVGQIVPPGPDIHKWLGNKLCSALNLFVIPEKKMAQIDTH